MTLREQVFFTSYQVAKKTYRVLPLPTAKKIALASRVIRLFSLLHPERSQSEEQINIIEDSHIFENRDLQGTESERLLSYDIFRDRVSSVKLQNILFPDSAKTAKRVMLILVPYYNVMSGGIYSMFSIATHAKQLRPFHDWEVLVMTVPNTANITYIRNRHFTNSIDVFRFSQILRLKESRELYIHIPEYAAEDFVDSLATEEKEFLDKKDSVHINILNQNTKLMPEADKLRTLKSNFTSVGQSVAHHAYYGKEFVDRYGTDLILLPAFTDLSNYPPVPFAEKAKLIIYSPDEAPHKKRCISLLKKCLPDFEFVEIWEITFDKYMEYASKCMFSITFGEGFDGYLAQPMLQGGMGFAVYNKEFFPSEEFLDYFNIFESQEEMLAELPNRISTLINSPDFYKKLNLDFQSSHNKLYSRNDYIERVKKLCQMDYDLHYEPFE